MNQAEVDWIRQHAVSFRLHEDDEEFLELQPLKSMIGDARVVQLGEQSHGDATCFEAKIRLIQFLHQEMGFDVLAFESGLYDCHRANEGFATDRDPAEVARQGVFGIWSGCRQMTPLWSYIASSAKTDHRLDLAGFDCQFTGSASAEYFTEDLKRISAKYGIRTVFSGDDSAVQFLEQLQDLVVQGEFRGSEEDWLQTLDAVIAALDAAKPITADDRREQMFWRQKLRSLKGYARYRMSDGSDRTGANGDASLNARDAQMADNLLWLSEQYLANRKIIVWAASFHVMRNAAEIEVPSKSVDYSGIIPMGHIVSQKLGDKSFTIGFTAGSGQAGAWFRPPFEIGSPPAGTLEDLCLRAGLENAIVPLRTVPESSQLSGQVAARPLGYTWMRAKWGRHFDAIVFQKTMQPAEGIR